jgi:hypothetical protein
MQHIRAGGFAAFALNGQRHDRPMLFMPISTETVLPYKEQARTYASDTVVPSIRLEFVRGNWDSSHCVLVPFTPAMRSRGEHAVLSAAVLTFSRKRWRFGGARLPLVIPAQIIAAYETGGESCATRRQAIGAGNVA